jgi:hypothetical protein
MQGCYDCSIEKGRESNLKDMKRLKGSSREIKEGMRVRS